MSKVALILDTNLAHPLDVDVSSYESFIIKNYDDAISFIERHDLVERVELFIPEIVIEEIVAQRSNALRSDLSVLKNLRSRFEGSNLVNIDVISNEIDCEEHIKLLKARKMREKVALIPIPADRGSLFSEILRMSLKKEPPFKQGKSDQGFKDAIMLLSVMSFFKDKNDYSEIFILSKDKGYLGVDEGLVRARCGANICIVRDINGIQNFISEKYKLSIALRKFLDEKLFDEKFKKSFSERIQKNTQMQQVFMDNDFLSFEPVLEKYSINEINEDSCEVVYPLILKIEKKTGEIVEMKNSINLLFKKEGDDWSPVENDNYENEE